MAEARVLQRHETGNLPDDLGTVVQTIVSSLAAQLSELTEARPDWEPAAESGEVRAIGDQ